MRRALDSWAYSNKNRVVKTLPDRNDTGTRMADRSNFIVRHFENTFSRAELTFASKRNS